MLADITEPTRAPFAEISMFSEIFAPLNSRRSTRSQPSTVSLPSLGLHGTISLALRPEEVGSPAAASGPPTIFAPTLPRRLC